MLERAALVRACALIVVGLSAAVCSKVPLTAPTNSTVTLSTSANILPTGGSTQVSAYVAESGGTPVQNGTSVRFTTNLGRVEPVELQTTNGRATTTFFAGDVAGIADVRATSGSAGGGTGTGTTPAANVVQITIGAAAVDSVTLRANPGFVPATGGTVEVIASVVAAGGRTLPDIPVGFSTSEGQLAAVRVLTDAAGEARTQLTTDRTATLTATAGSKTSNQVVVTRRDPPPTPNVTLTATSETATNLGQRWTFTAAVTGTDVSSLPSRYEWDWGDGENSTTNGNVSAHVYTVGGIRRIVTVRVSLANGQTLTATTEIIVAVLPP